MNAWFWHTRWFFQWCTMIKRYIYIFSSLLNKKPVFFIPLFYQHYTNASCSFHTSNNWNNNEERNKKKIARFVWLWHPCAIIQKLDIWSPYEKPNWSHLDTISHTIDKSAFFLLSRNHSMINFVFIVFFCPPLYISVYIFLFSVGAVGTTRILRIETST